MKRRRAARAAARRAVAPLPREPRVLCWRDIRRTSVSRRKSSGSVASACASAYHDAESGEQPLCHGHGRSHVHEWRLFTFARYLSLPQVRQRRTVARRCACRFAWPRPRAPRLTWTDVDLSSVVMSASQNSSLGYRTSCLTFLLGVGPWWPGPKESPSRPLGPEVAEVSRPIWAGGTLRAALSCAPSVPCLGSHDDERVIAASPRRASSP